MKIEWKEVHGQLVPVKVYSFGELSKPYEQSRWHRKLSGEDVSKEPPSMVGRLVIRRNYRKKGARGKPPPQASTGSDGSGNAA